MDRDNEKYVKGAVTDVHLWQWINMTLDISNLTYSEFSEYGTKWTTHFAFNYFNFNYSLQTTPLLSFFYSFLPLTFLKYRYKTLWNTSGSFFPLKQDAAWYKIVPSKVIRLTKSPPWKAKWQLYDVMCPVRITLINMSTF